MAKIDVSLTQDLISGTYVLNRLQNIFSQDVQINDVQTKQIGSALSSLNELVDVLDILENGMESVDAKIELPGPSNERIYSIGETCLLIDPFDNYRLFRLYTDFENRIPLDISDGQKLYLVFRYNNREIRIPEYETFSPYITVDKVNGQVLFKINKKQATDILGFKNKVFYVTRVYETYNPATETVVSSDEEVIFSGYWADRNREKESNLMQRIIELQEKLEQKDLVIETMTETIADLANQNAEYAESQMETQAALDDIQKQYDDLCAQLEEAYPGITSALTGGNIGELIDSQTVLIDYSNADAETVGYLDKVTQLQDSIIS